MEVGGDRGGAAAVLTTPATRQQFITFEARCSGRTQAHANLAHRAQGAERQLM
jgi:hypothetical protein